MYADMLQVRETGEYVLRSCLCIVYCPQALLAISLHAAALYSALSSYNQKAI